MKTIEFAADGSIPSRITLKNLIDQLTQSLLPVTDQKKCSLVNDVPAGLNIIADEGRVSPVLNGILNAFITYSCDSCIRISTDITFDNMVQVNIKDDNACNTYAVACSLQKVVKQAESIGGHITITNQRQRITTICFRFPVMSEERILQSSLRGAA